jgi:hypothetical protein
VTDLDLWHIKSKCIFALGNLPLHVLAHTAGVWSFDYFGRRLEPCQGNRLYSLDRLKAEASPYYFEIQGGPSIAAYEDEEISR